MREFIADFPSGYLRKMPFHADREVVRQDSITEYQQEKESKILLLQHNGNLVYVAILSRQLVT